MDKEEGDAKKHELKLRMRLEALIFYLASLTIRAEVVDYGEFFVRSRENTIFKPERDQEITKACNHKSIAAKALTTVDNNSTTWM